MFSFYRIAAAATGVILIIAGAIKGGEAAAALHTGPAPTAHAWMILGHAGLEVAFGIWLQSGARPETARRVALVCFAGMACVSLSKALAGDRSCGCFGSVSVSPWLTAALDSAVVLALLRFRPTTSRAPAPKSLLFQWIVSSLIVLAVLWMVGSPALMWRYLAAGDAAVVVLKPEEWVRKRFALLDHIDVGARLAQGRWIVVLYHSDCPACQEAIPRYEHLAGELVARREGPRVALIEMPPYGVADPGIVPPTSPCLLGRLDRSKMWFLTTPAEIHLRDGVVMPAGE